MVSRRQLEANRANARRSTGPRTPAGKMRASKNALKHGLRAKTIVIGDEKPEEFEELREAVLAHYGSSTALEHDAADRYAATLWRLRRVPAIEAALAEAARQQAYTEECTALEQQHDEELDWEARQVCDAQYGNDRQAILDAKMTTSYSDQASLIFDELLSERPFQPPKMTTIPAAQTFLWLIEAADSFDILGKLNRYEIALVNIAARQRKELESLRSAAEAVAIIDL